MSPEPAPLSDANSPQAAVATVTRRRELLAALSIVVVFVVALVGLFTRNRWARPKSLDEIRKLVERQAWSSAETSLTRYHSQHPNDAQAMMLEGRLLAAKRDYTACAAILEKVQPDAPERGDALLRAGQAWLQAKHRRQAERVWKSCLELSSGELELPGIHQACRQQLCSLYALERRRDDLWDMTEQMADHAAPQQRREALAMRVRFEFEMVEPQVALATLEPAIEISPQDLLSGRACGLYQLAAGNTEKARAQLYRCLQADRANPVMWEAWLQCLYQTADLFGLEQAMRDLPPSTESSAECWKHRSIVADRKDDLDLAMEAARRAIQLEPLEPQHHHRLGQLLLRVGKKSEAQTYLTRNQELQKGQEELRDAYDAYRRQYARAQPEQRAELAFHLGEAFEKLGRNKEAASWYRVVLSETPAHTPSITAMERVLAATPAESKSSSSLP